jgi:hypothetical protein
MQRGSLAIISRKEGPAVWQFRWSEKDLHGARVQRKRVIGTVKRYPNEAAARCYRCPFGRDQFRQSEDGLPLDYRRAALRPFRAT